MKNILILLGLATLLSAGTVVMGCLATITATPRHAVAPAEKDLEPAATENIATATTGTVATNREPAAPAAAGKWSESRKTSPMDDSQTVVMGLDAENEVRGWLKSERPRLIVRCMENRTEVYMVTGMSASIESGDLDRHTVRVRFDDATAQQQSWTESTDNQALFAPGAIAFARRLASAKTLRMQFVPFNASPATVTFDVSGFDQHIEKVAAACKWQR